MQSQDKAALLTVEEMYRADQRAVDHGVPSWDLMMAAGNAVARQVADLANRWQSVTVLCGPGNNGGDGYVAAARLRAMGFRVRVYALGDPNTLSGDAAQAFALWQQTPGAQVYPLSLTCLDQTDFIIDALFGAGLNRPPEGVVAEVLSALKDRKIRTVAVDVPSGVDGNSGAILGDVAPAELTVCFFRPKPGHYLYPAKALCGRLVVADIGIPERVLGDITPSVHINGPAIWQIPTPGWQDHKYSRGHVLIAGSFAMSGAARLAVKAARRQGAGLVTIAAPRDAMALYLADAPGALFSALPSGLEAEDVEIARPALDAFLGLVDDPRRTAVLIGPGLPPTEALRQAVLGVLSRAKTAVRQGQRKGVVLDAGALSAFAQQPEALTTAISQAAQAGTPVVLTPHDGEFARLFPDITSGSRLDRARQAAEHLGGAALLLKGADTVVCSGGNAVLSPHTAVDLATGGTGDVLAGMIVALVAQGMAPLQSASCANWLHSEVARRFGAGLIAEDLPDGLPDVLADLR